MKLLFFTIISVVTMPMAFCQNTFPASGSVGIGTVAPNYPLEVHSGNQTVLRLRSVESDVFNPQIDLYDADRVQETVISSSDGTTTGAFIGSYSNHPILFGTNAKLDPNAKVSISTAGNLGVGNLTSSYKFAVKTPSTLGFALETNGSDIASPQMDLKDPFRGVETVLTSGYGTTSGSFVGSYSTHPLMFGTNVATDNFAKMVITPSGNVGIGTMSPSEKLTVNGSIRAKENRVDASPWPDYVFHANYRLTPLSEVEKFIKSNNHLPNIPPAKDVLRDGISVGEMNVRLLEKIEEMTLHLIEQDKRTKQQGEVISNLLEEVSLLKAKQ